MNSMGMNALSAVTYYFKPERATMSNEETKDGPIIWTRYVEQDDGSELEEEVQIPAKFEVCDGCRGNGTHVNRNIDGNGISSEEWGEWDIEEREDYMSGRYDVTCEDCGGMRVIKVPDWEHMDPKLAEEYSAHLDDEAHYARMCEMERRMGA